MIVVWLFLTVPWVCLQFVIVVFTDHTHYFLTIFSLIFIFINLYKAFTFSINGTFLQSFTSMCSFFILLKTHSHYADVAMVHPDEGQPLYQDASGHIFNKKNKLLSHLTNVTR